MVTSWVWDFSRVARPRRSRHFWPPGRLRLF